MMKLKMMMAIMLLGQSWHAAKLIIRVQRENALKYSVRQDSEGERGAGY